MDSDEGPASGVGSKWKSGGFGMGHHLTILRWGFILQIHALITGPFDTLMKGFLPCSCFVSARLSHPPTSGQTDDNGQ